MGTNSNGKKAEVQRANKGRNGYIASDRDPKFGRDGRRDGNGGTLGANSQNRARRTITVRLLGGIIAQLIEETEDQLGDARECIAKYERTVQKLSRRLENLKRLQELQQEADSNQHQ